MKISARQVRAVLAAYVRRDAQPGRGGITAMMTFAILKAPDDLRRHFELLPEQRDIVVHDLRSKIRAGNYHVSSSEIVDALLGRLAANLIAD
jgi:hypothetical protein